MNDKNEQNEAEPAEAGPSTTLRTGPAVDNLDTEELQRQRDDYYDRLLRKTAEFDNYRKRVERDRQAMAESATADLVRDLLPLVDNLELALKADSGAEGADAYRRGVELIHRQLLDALRRRNVKPIETVGVDFDPHFHQAVTYEPAAGRRDGEIVEEFARGYLIGDRLLRPAMVKVAKGETNS